MRRGILGIGAGHQKRDNARGKTDQQQRRRQQPHQPGEADKAGAQLRLRLGLKLGLEVLCDGGLP